MVNILRLVLCPWSARDFRAVHYRRCGTLSDWHRENRPVGVLDDFATYRAEDVFRSIGEWFVSAEAMPVSAHKEALAKVTPVRRVDQKHASNGECNAYDDDSRRGHLFSLY